MVPLTSKSLSKVLPHKRVEKEPNFPSRKTASGTNLSSKSWTPLSWRTPPTTPKEALWQGSRKFSVSMSPSESILTALFQVVQMIKVQSSRRYNNSICFKKGLNTNARHQRPAPRRRQRTWWSIPLRKNWDRKTVLRSPRANEVSCSRRQIFCSYKSKSRNLENKPLKQWRKTTKAAKARSTRLCLAGA